MWYARALVHVYKTQINQSFKILTFTQSVRPVAMNTVRSLLAPDTVLSYV